MLEELSRGRIMRGLISHDKKIIWLVDCIKISFLIVMVCYSYTVSFHWGKPGRGYTGSIVSFSVIRLFCIPCVLAYNCQEKSLFPSEVLTWRSLPENKPWF